MKLEKILKLTLTEEEIENIQKTAEIFNDICNSYYEEDADCKQCPLYDLCRKCGNEKVPHNILYDLVDQLNTTKGA